MIPFLPESEPERSAAMKSFSDFIGMITRFAFCASAAVIFGRLAGNANQGQKIALYAMEATFAAFAILLAIFVEERIHSYAKGITGKRKGFVAFLARILSGILALGITASVLFGVIQLLTDMSK